MSYKKILCATYLGSDPSEAIKQADERASLYQAEVTYLCVVPLKEPASVLFPHFHKYFESEMTRIQAETYGKFSELIRDITGRDASELNIVVETGSPYAEITRKAAEIEAELLIIPSGDSTEEGSPLLGHISEMIVRYAHCPVLIARPRIGAERRILAATDFSDPSLPAVTMAAEEAIRSGRSLTLMHCLDMPNEFQSDVCGGIILPHGILAELQIEELRQEADRQLRLAMQNLPLQGETIVSRETPTQAIIHMAENLKVELVVIGTSGKTGLARWVLGSVAEAVVRNSRCSTMVVRLHDRQNLE